MFNRSIIISMVLLIGSSLAMGQVSQPTTMPELGSPKAALKSFALALNAGDATRIRRLLNVTSSVEQKMASAMVDMAGALADLNQALKDKFGEEQANIAQGDSTGELKRSLTAIDAADEKIDGDTATISLAIAPPVKMKKVDGSWKISLEDEAKKLLPQQVDDMSSMLSNQLKQLKSVTLDVKAGKFSTATAATDALHEMMDGPPPTTAPTSQPVK